MSSTALRLLQQLVKESESNLTEDDEDRAGARRCWNVEARIHDGGDRVMRNIRQAHMNPASLQKPASIKDFCDVSFFSPSCRHASRVPIFLLAPGSRLKIFFSQAVPGSACEGRFKFGFERIGAALIRMREIPDRVCMRRRRVEEGPVRRFACRAIAPSTGVVPRWHAMTLPGVLLGAFRLPECAATAAIGRTIFRIRAPRRRIA
jgi:hypothetical protein